VPLYFGLPVANATSSSDPLGVFTAFDSLGVPGNAFYTVRGLTSTGAVTPWSAPVAAVDGTQPHTLFCAPGGVTTSSCGSFTSPCGAVQDALDQSPATGATVLLLPGIYTGARNRGLTMAGKVRGSASCVCVCASLSDMPFRLLTQGIRVIGLAGSVGTVLNCNSSDRGFLFNSGESIQAGAAVQGVTITRGVAFAGAGMVFFNSSAAVSDVTITNCKADGSGTPTAGVLPQTGGAVTIQDGNATFDRCTFSNSQAGENGGGGLHVSGNSVPQITNSLITGNVLFNPGRVRG